MNPGEAQGSLPGVVTLAIQIGANQAVVGLDSTVLPLDIDAELSLAFDGAENLCASTLGLSAALVNPLDPAFRARLPNDALVPLALPLVIQVEPPANASCTPGGGPLAFNDTVRAEIHTHLLPYASDSPLRLYKAPLGGTFRDITDGVAPGSVRTGGRTGGFSEFLIVIDLTAPAAAAVSKYDALGARLTNPAIDPAVRTALAMDLADSRSAFDVGDYPAAMFALDTFVARVRGASSAQIPDRWRAQRDLENIAGDLIGDAASLKFVIGRL
ncbi:MAG TPA: DUF6689 family protein [Candidatus Saccharimonadia bacterium]|nr:DUF6689 family protein [Candidatus Saccharimonadia bacterium]